MVGEGSGIGILLSGDLTELRELVPDLDSKMEFSTAVNAYVIEGCGYFIGHIPAERVYEKLCRVINNEDDYESSGASHVSSIALNDAPHNEIEVAEPRQIPEKRTETEVTPPPEKNATQTVIERSGPLLPPLSMIPETPPIEQINAITAQHQCCDGVLMIKSSVEHSIADYKDVTIKGLKQLQPVLHNIIDILKELDSKTSTCVHEIAKLHQAIPTNQTKTEDGVDQPKKRTIVSDLGQRKKPRKRSVSSSGTRDSGSYGSSSSTCSDTSYSVSPDKH